MLSLRDLEQLVCSAIFIMDFKASEEEIYKVFKERGISNWKPFTIHQRISSMLRNRVLQKEDEYLSLNFPATTIEDISKYFKEYK